MFPFRSKTTALAAVVEQSTVSDRPSGAVKLLTTEVTFRRIGPRQAGSHGDVAERPGRSLGAYEVEAGASRFEHQPCEMNHRPRSVCGLKL